MSNNLKYLDYVIRHKWYVLVEAIKLGIPWRGLIHDLSKLKPSEWIPYRDYFYSKTDVSTFTVTSSTGFISHKSYNQRRFDEAWNSHQKVNKHHWQYWVLLKDDGTIKTLAMPYNYILEMIADWVGAGKAIHGKNEVLEWYYKNKEKMIMHPTTRKVVERILQREYGNES